jgi:multisubunit Na+/H+ antiporter MnhB subunit
MNEPRHRPLIVVGFAVVVAAMVGGLGIAIWTLPTQATGLAFQVEGRLDLAGAENPVTAVLLNFRGYDTMLELTVMLLAVLGARALTGGGSADDVSRIDLPVTPVLRGFVRVITPVMIVVAGYLLWVGSHAPGGAFQAAAVLAALGVLLRLTGVACISYFSESGERWLLTAGMAVFLAVGVGTLSVGNRLLEFPPSGAKWLILLIETVATLSVAAILLALYCSGTLRPPAASHDQPERNDR